MLRRTTISLKNYKSTYQVSSSVHIKRAQIKHTQSSSPSGPTNTPIRTSRMSHTPPTGHCRAQHHALQYYSTGASTLVIPETVLSEAQEYDWAACYNEVERWHTPEPESVHKQGRSCTMFTVVRIVLTMQQSRESRDRLWCIREVTRQRVRSYGH